MTRFGLSAMAISFGLIGCSLWPTADIDCRQSGRCQTPALPDMQPPASDALVFGQPDVNTLLCLQNGLNNPTHAIRVGEKLIIADSGSHRVLISDPTSRSLNGYVVLGQPDLTTNVANQGGLSARSLNMPSSVASDGQRLLVGDSGNHRVLIWNQIPTTNAQPADLVLGQPDMVTANSSCTARDFGTGLHVGFGAGGEIVVTDTSNHRALVFNKVTQNYQAADGVIGQANFTANAMNAGMSTVSALGLRNPTGTPIVSGSYTGIVDRGNHRVLFFKGLDTGSAALRVLGQANMTSSAVNGGNAAVNSAGMNAPESGDSAPNGTLAIADRANNRVLLWKGFPTADGIAASLVIGQSGFTTNGAGSGSSGLTLPTGIGLLNRELLISDAGNHRVLSITSDLTTSGMPADSVFGQPTLTTNVAENPGPPSATIFQLPTRISAGGGRLAMTDTNNNRVLLWSSTPTVTNQPANLLLGQLDFAGTAANHGNPRPTADGLSAANAVWTDGTRIVVGDGNRVLIWNSWPEKSLQSANVVLGQPDMTVNSVNYGGVSAQSLNFVQDVYSDGIRLYVADTRNHRVLLWNTFPTANQQPADVVLGQPDMVSNISGAGEALCKQSPQMGNQALLTCPRSVVADGTRVYIADSSNRRVMVWNSLPTANGQSADFALGQSSLQATNDPVPAANSGNFGSVNGLALSGGRLYAADATWNRVLFWNAPGALGQPADGVLGQTDFTTTTPSSLYPLNGGSFAQPLGLAATADRVYVTDSGNSRLLALSRP